MFEQLVNALRALPQIEAMALGGSRASENFDAKSDYDLYLYCTEEIPESVRRDILNRYCSYTEIGNHFWELEDDCTLKDGIDIDILYRNLDAYAADVADVAEHFNARNAYTTCNWHNLITCRVLYDRCGRLTAAKERFTIPYPDELRKNILCRNRKLLHGTLPAYDGQLTKALRRGDLVSVNHRAAAFIESYFDVIFALNRMTHPGEKRLVQLCLRDCKILPERFEENLNALFAHLFSEPDSVPQDLARIVDALDAVLNEHGV